MKLINQTQNAIVIENLDLAKNIFSRMKGLLGKKSILENEGLFIERCNSIHTFFMNFPIDVVFLDKNLKIKKILHNIQPNKIVMPIWGARSVVELSAGICKKRKLQIEDQLHVES